MSIFIFTLFTISLAMSAVIVLLLFLNKVLANKIPAVFRYYTWLIVLLGLLIPFRPSIAIPFEPVQVPISPEALNISEEHIENGVTQMSERESAPSISVVQSAEKQPVSYINLLFGIWIISALVILVFHLRVYAKFIVSVRRWGVDITDEQTLSVFQKVWNDMKFEGNRIALKECIFLSSPMLIGFRNPAILLPEKEISPDELEHIFRHELTHYRRKDLWMNVLVLVVSTIHWFNPFVYLMAKTIRADCEVACDEAVVSGDDADKRRHYGETIIGFIGAKNSMTPVLSTYFYGGKNSMKKRLFSIMDISQKRKGLAAACLVAVTTVTLLAGSVFAVATASNTEQYIGEEKAKSIAFTHAGLTESQVTFIKAHLERDDGRMIYDVDFYSGNVEYDYEIDAVNGAILEFDRDIENYSIPNNSAAQNTTSTQSTPQYISVSKAKSIALTHAGLTESQVTFIKTHLERDDGRTIYDVEFYGDNVEYDYEIDAVDGAILEFDRDIENYSIPNNSTAQNTTSTQSTPQTTPHSTAQYINEAKAKSIALTHAGLTESQVIFIKAHLERDDGRTIYDVEFYSGNVEYDYEIDAVNGAILEFDRDIENYSIPNNSANQVTATPQPTQQPTMQQPTTQPTQNSNEQYIGESKAKSIALTHAGLTESQVIFIKAHLERDDGRMTYDVEFYGGNVEYDYEIDAISGTILEFDRDIENYSIPNNSANQVTTTPQPTQPPTPNSTEQYIGDAKAKAIALSAAGLSESQVSRMKISFDREDGVMIYEVEFNSGRMEYEYEIDAISGNILKADVDYDD